MAAMGGYSVMKNVLLRRGMKVMLTLAEERESKPIIGMEKMTGCSDEVWYGLYQVSRWFSKTH